MTLTEAEDHFCVACGRSIMLLSLNAIVVAHAYANLQTTEDMLHVKHCFAKEWLKLSNRFLELLIERGS